MTTQQKKMLVVFLLGLGVGLLIFIFLFRVSLSQHNQLRQQMPLVLEEQKRALAAESLIQSQYQVLSITHDQLEEEFSKLYQKVNDQERLITLYENIMSPSLDNVGLQLSSANMTLSNIIDNTYDYRLVFTQHGIKQRKTISGELEMHIHGVLGDEQQSYNFLELLVDAKHDFATLSFEYFQVIEGSLTLPDNFIPDNVTIKAQQNNATSPWFKELTWSSLINSERGLPYVGQ